MSYNYIMRDYQKKKHAKKKQKTCKNLKRYQLPNPHITKYTKFNTSIKMNLSLRSRVV